MKYYYTKNNNYLVHNNYENFIVSFVKLEDGGFTFSQEKYSDNYAEEIQKLLNDFNLKEVIFESDEQKMLKLEIEKTLTTIVELSKLIK